MAQRKGPDGLIRVRHAVDGGRLIVPFHDMADRFALNIGGMDPIDEGAPLGFGQAGPYL
jgi:hypothetical protein